MKKKRLIVLVSGGMFLMVLLSAVNFIFNPLGLGPERQRVLPETFFEHPTQDRGELKLLVDGKEAFQEILNAINNAKRSIYVQTFIWKDDHIGKIVTDTLKAAANRGVKITVRKDALGTFFELGDIIHGKPSPVFTASGLKGKKNITVSVDLFADTDHSKYFIVDDKVVILGGMNIADEYHQKWHDYMVKIESSPWAAAFEEKVLQARAWPDKAPFFIAVNDSSVVEIRTALIEIIDHAQHNLIIEHAYFSTDKIIAAVERAAARGVKVNIILPERPDTHMCANWVTINKLLQSDDQKRPQIFLFPKMMHAKVILVDGAVAAVGSANLTLRSMLTSREVTLFLHGGPDHPFIDRLRQQLVADMIASKAVTLPYDIDLSIAVKAIVDKHVW